MTDALLYRTFWRWHFYAGLFVLPFVLVLSLTGAAYLFKPQIDRWEERPFQHLGTQDEVTADEQLTVALVSFPGSRFDHYRLPQHAGDAAMIQLGLEDQRRIQVFVSPQGTVLGALDPETRLTETLSRLHGSLLLGRAGDWLVELAASWTIVMILTGLFLWWPRPFAVSGTLWPRFSLMGRPFLKDLHRVAGFWIAGLVLVMLVSGLPWAGAWGSSFLWARTQLGLVEGPQDWKIGADASRATLHTNEPAAAAMPQDTATASSLPLSAFVARARAEHLTFPALVLPPHAPQRFGPPVGEEWMAKSEAQNRTLQRVVTYDPATGAQTGRSGFADRHVIDRVVNYGIAWHEGQLFGVVNQIVGVLTALALIVISSAGVLMWLRRRPQGELGAPLAIAHPPNRPMLVAGIVLLALLLPLFGLSLLGVLLIESFLLRRIPRLSAWLGLRA